MIAGFKPQFNLPIMKGDKIHTIRGGTRWRQGLSIQFYNGVRTKNMKKFTGDLVCISTQNIKIRWHEEKGLRILQIWIDGNLITPQEQHDLAENDGFASLEEFAKWFNDSFDGQIVHWTNYQYG